MKKYIYSTLSNTWKCNLKKEYYSEPRLTLVQKQKVDACGFKSMLNGREIPRPSYEGGDKVMVNNYINFTKVDNNK